MNFEKVICSLIVFGLFTLISCSKTTTKITELSSKIQSINHKN